MTSTNPLDELNVLYTTTKSSLRAVKVLISMQKNYKYLVEKLDELKQHLVQQTEILSSITKLLNQHKDAAERLYLKQHKIYDLSDEDLENRLTRLKIDLNKSLNELDDLFVLNFWVVFERYLRNYLMQQGTCLQHISTPVHTDFGIAVYELFKKEAAEHWKSKEILDILKIQENDNLIGDAKQIVEYRDWIAHKNPNKPPSRRVTPNDAYTTLNNLIQRL